MKEFTGKTVVITGAASGIGLAISSELLESFRGTLNISNNKEGKGTEVIIRIPIWHE